MNRCCLSSWQLALLMSGLICSLGSMATQIDVPAGHDALRAAVAAAREGAVLRLMPGRHVGPIVITTPLTLLGDKDVIVDAGGQGRVITIDAPNVKIQGLTVRGSGLDLSVEDAGIFVTAKGKAALIQDNLILDNLIGVYLKGPQAAEVRDNVIEGRQDLRVNERGNGVQMWNTPGSIVANNRFRYGRDGIFVNTSRENKLIANEFRELRFAVHFMYGDDSEIRDNYSTGNHIAYALMFSHRLQVTGNVSFADRDRGLLFNYANDSNVVNNHVSGGANKCVFIYNANGNRIHHNHFEACEIGVHFTAGSEGNDIYANAFIANRTQVKYVGTQHLEWSREGKGNYWSDNTAYDVNGDGIGDRAYRPNGLVDHMLWRHPRAKLLLGSPALQVLAWVQSEFPGLHPGGIIDSAPLMVPSSIVASGVVRGH